MTVFFLFLLSLAVGCLTTQFWVPGSDFGRGYFQVNALVVLGLLGLAIAVWVLYPLDPFGARTTLGSVAMTIALLAAFVYYGFIWREAWAGSRWPAALALAATSLLLSPSSSAASMPPMPRTSTTRGSEPRDALR